MYATILVTLDTTPTDRAIIEHMKLFARQFNSTVALLHVATGIPAQWAGSDAGGAEVEEDQAYLEQVRAEFFAAGVTARAILAFGDPVKEIVKWVEANPTDLIAMSTHGHRGVGDFIHGTTANHVQHSVSVPVLMLRAK